MGRTRIRTGTIRATFGNTTDQSYVVGVSKAVNFNSENEKEGIIHDVVVNNEIITFPTAGVYNVVVEPHYTRTSGGGTDALNIYLQRDSGNGFENIPFSNIKVTVGSAAEESSTSLTGQIRFNAGDRLRVMAQVENTNLILDAFPAFGTPPNDVPSTSSILLNVNRIGV